MAPDDDDNHRYRWRDETEQLRSEIEELRQKFASLERRLLGPKSEKMPPIEGEVRKARPTATADDAKRLRQQNLKARESLPTDVVPVPVPDAERTCKECGKADMKPVGNGTPSVTYVYIAAHFRRRIYQRETVACSCGKCIVTAPCPDKLADRSPYSASFIAALILQKCEDGLPIYRMEKQFERLGIPMARSTMNDLFHRGATLLAPIAARILARIAASEIVFADETSLKMQSSDKRAFVWTFLDDHFTGFVFSPTRSGDVPVAVLGESQGELMADLYTGYNAITVPGRRRRAGCLAHARRKIFEAKDNPEAQEALDLIRDLYCAFRVSRSDKTRDGDQAFRVMSIGAKRRVSEVCWSPDSRCADGQVRSGPEGHQPGAVAPLVLRREGPCSASLCAPWMTRSQIASAMVGSARKSCQRSCLS